MNVSPFRPTSPTAASSSKALSPSGTGVASPALSQKRCVPAGFRGLHQDGFDAAPRREAQMEKLLQGVSSLLQTVQALQQMLQTQGAKPVSGSGSSSPAELAPAAAPSSAPSSSVSPSGDAKLGAGMPPALSQYKGAIESAAAKAGVPASMIAGQIWQESRGNLSAATTNGGNGLTDTGLMQVNPNTFQELQSKHPELQGKNLADPETNILAGAFYMKDMKEQFGSWDLALRAYNSGPNGVDRNNANALPAGTGDATYVQKVKQFWDTISTGQGSLPA